MQYKKTAALTRIIFRMLDPPSRSSMWRLGFSTPPNYDDNGLYCGGFGVKNSFVLAKWFINSFVVCCEQVTYNEKNKGRCGECGDEWSLPRPRPNDEGGMYGTGIIGRTYNRGAVFACKLHSVLISNTHNQYVIDSGDSNLR